MRILLVSVSSGAGHVRAAQALEKAFKNNAPTVEVRHIDLLRFMKMPLQWFYGPGYTLVMDRFPLLWGGFFWVSHFMCRLPGSKFFGLLQSIWTRAFFEELDRYNPDVIAATHFFPIQLLENRKGLKAPLDVVVTDFLAHSAWRSPVVRRYYVAGERAKRDLVSAGAGEDQIEITGLPIDSSFSPSPIRNWPKKESAPMVLVMGGGLGHPSLPLTVKALLDCSAPLRIVSVSGKNEEVRRAIGRLMVPPGKSITNLGFTSDIPALLQEADVVVTKAGGLTVAESMAVGVPMVIYPCFPGQEKGNAVIVENAGAGLKAASALEVGRKVSELVNNPKRGAAMSDSARKLGRPLAAIAVARRLMEGS